MQSSNKVTPAITDTNPSYTMNMKLLLASILAPAVLSAEVLLTDDFNDASIDAGKWSVILPNGSSTVIESGGVLITTARGVLGSVSSFSSPYEISGTFSMLDNLEHFNIVFRSDLSAGDFGERRGLFVSFSNDGDQISIQRYNNAGDTAILAQKSYSLITNQSYYFSIIDDGSVVMLSIGGSLELTALSDYFTGSQVGFYSREFGSTATSIDSIGISAIPEPATYALFIGLGVLAIVAVKRKSGRRQGIA